MKFRTPLMENEFSTVRCWYIFYKTKFSFSIFKHIQKLFLLFTVLMRRIWHCPNASSMPTVSATGGWGTRGKKSNGALRRDFLFLNGGGATTSGAAAPKRFAPKWRPHCFSADSPLTYNFPTNGFSVSTSTRMLCRPHVTRGRPKNLELNNFTWILSPE